MNKNVTRFTFSPTILSDHIANPSLEENTA